MALTSAENTVKNKITGVVWRVDTTYDPGAGTTTTIITTETGSTFARGPTDQVMSQLRSTAAKSPAAAQEFFNELESTANDQKFSLNGNAAAYKKTVDKNKSTGNNKTNDDTKLPENQYAKSTVTTTGAVGSKITGPGKRTWNPLGDFSSYTYRLSLYALSPDAYNVYKKTGQWDRTQLSLIVQSGGASSSEKLDAPRGEGFDLDFYIDDLELTSIINAKEAGMATNSVYYKFKIHEPYGMTFPTKLLNLQAALRKKSKFSLPEITKFVESTHGTMLLSIRFYGYDENGQLVSSSKYNNGSTTKNLDESATFERSFTVYISKFNFKIEGKGATYDVECRAFDQQIGAGAKRSELTVANGQGSTVKEAIGGIVGSATEKATTTGILDQLNKQQQDNKKSGACEIADVYAVEYEEGSAIKDSLIIEENINKDRVPMTRVSKPSGSNARASASAKSETLKQSRTITFGKGTTIMQAIDQIITQSSYVDDALTSLDSEEAQSVQQGQSQTTENAKPKTLQWYIVSPHVEILGYDNIRKDFAYKITYLIQSYDVPYVQSTNIKAVPKYPGPHKIYNYWYTGKNSEVLSYDQTLNNLYFLYSKMAYDNSQGTPNASVPIQPKPSSNADPVGKPTGSGEGAASIKTFLYSPNDQQGAKIKILGDPDFLMQSTSGTIGQMLTKWYGPDFTINPNSGQVFIEIIFNQVDDYSNVDGLMTPNGLLDTMSFGDKNNPDMASVAKGTVFMVLRVISRFSRGKFTQEFMTTLPPNFKPVAGSNGTGASGKTGGSSSATGGKREANQTAATAARTGVNLSNTRAGGGRGTSQGGPTAWEASQNNNKKSVKIISPEQATLNNLKQNARSGSTVNDDQLVAPAGTYTTAGRESNVGVNPLTGARSVMFKK